MNQTVKIIKNDDDDDDDDHDDAMLFNVRSKAGS